MDESENPYRAPPSLPQEPTRAARSTLRSILRIAGLTVLAVYMLGGLADALMTAALTIKYLREEDYVWAAVFAALTLAMLTFVTLGVVALVRAWKKPPPGTRSQDTTPAPQA